MNYLRLLDAAIGHLEDLKSQGKTYLNIAPETLLALQQPIRVKVQVASWEIKAEEPLTTATLTQQREKTLAARPQTQPDSPHNGSRKKTAIAELMERAAVCLKCPNLASSRKNVVFGMGDIESPLMFVGEAPGADEDAQGEPFVGKAGELLTRIIKTMGFDRNSVYIANVLKCRPDTPGQTAGNRKPTTDEMKTCLPYLLEQIDLIKPRVIVALGATAVEGLFGKPMPITKLRGN